MNIITYRKKPVVVQAVEVEYRILDIIAGWCGGKVQYDSFGVGDGITISTLEGDMVAKINDFIIKSVAGEFYPCKPDIFKQTYEKTKAEQIK